MPEVYFVGEILKINVDTEAVSLTFSILPGNANWSLYAGVTFYHHIEYFTWFLNISKCFIGFAYGETHASVVDPCSGEAVLCHPIDAHYITSKVEGWPQIVVEVIHLFNFFRFKLIL